MGILESLPVQRVRPVLFLPLWLGSLRDATTNGNNATVSSTPSWQTYAGSDRVYCTGAEYLSVAHSATVDVTDATFFIGGLFPSQFTNQSFFRKLGAGVRYQCYSGNGSNLILYDGTRASTLATSIVGATSFAVTWVGGQVPTFYVSGTSAGNGNLVVNTAGTNAALTLLGEGANACRGLVSCVLAYDKALTSTEVQALHDWSADRFTPRKQWPGGLRGFSDNLKTARTSIANETTGHLSNTGFAINSGTWKVSEDQYGKYINCVVAGQVEHYLEAADEFTTRTFAEDGSATLTKNPTNIQVDALAGDKIYRIELTDP